MDTLFIRKTWLVLLAGGLMATAGPAMAQQEEDESAALDRVEVTGTRIRQSDFEGANPIQSVSREDLERSGVQSIGDFIQQLTISGCTSA